MWGLLLFLSLLLLFYSILIGDFSRLENLKEILIKRGVQATGAAFFLIVGSIVFKTPLAGIFWAILGWLLPVWIINFIQNRRKEKLRRIVKDFINSSSGLFDAGQTTPEVIQISGRRIPEPFATDFNNMLAQNQFNPDTTFPEMFEALSKKYKLPELSAVSAIISAAEQTGGPKAASQGLKKLARALRQRDKLMAERKKAMHEPRIAAFFVIGLLISGLVLDVTVLAHLFDTTSGKLVLSIGSALTVGIILMAYKITQSGDLA